MLAKNELARHRQLSFAFAITLISTRSNVVDIRRKNTKISGATDAVALIQ